MRTTPKKQMANTERKALEQKRSAESKERKEKRKEKGRTEEAEKAIQCSPEGKKAAEILKAKRGDARQKEQANYQKVKARSAARAGGRRKQLQTERHNRRETR